MGTPAEYRAAAAECLQAMQLSMAPDVRAALLQMAQRWTELAQRLENNQASTADDLVPTSVRLADPAA